MGKGTDNKIRKNLIISCLVELIAEQLRGNNVETQKSSVKTQLEEHLSAKLVVKIIQDLHERLTQKAKAEFAVNLLADVQLLRNGKIPQAGAAKAESILPGAIAAITQTLPIPSTAEASSSTAAPATSSTSTSTARSTEQPQPKQQQPQQPQQPAQAQPKPKADSSKKAASTSKQAAETEPSKKKEPEKKAEASSEDKKRSLDETKGSASSKDAPTSSKAVGGTVEVKAEDESGESAKKKRKFDVSF